MTLIFVDANVFLNIYKRGFRVRRKKKDGDVLSLGDVLDLIGDRVLLPAVTHNEIVRNRCGVLPPAPEMQSIHSLHHLTGRLEEFQTKFKALKSDLKASFSQAHEAVRLGTDPISQAISHLSVVQETPEEYAKAARRKALGMPPGKRAD